MEEYDLIVIGAGAGGLVVANGAVKSGKKTLLIERGHWGGDCTNYGCVPSKSIIASAEALALIKDKNLAVNNKISDSTNADVFNRIREIRAGIRHHEEPEALKAAGLHVAEGSAKFIDKNCIEVDQKEKFYGSTIVIAAGSRPFVPKIEGLDKVPYLTNETIFELKQTPKSMIVIGGGPIGSELAQAMQRLGSKVTMIHKHSLLLAKEPKKAAEVLHKKLTEEGMTFKLGVEPIKVEQAGQNIAVDLKQGDKIERIEAEALLISVGRRPNVEDLQLEKAGVEYDEKGIKTKRTLQTSQKHIYAIGDVIGAPFFTHLAENHGRTVLRNIIFPWIKQSRSDQPVPRVTYTDPEIASIGMLANEAIEKYSENSIAVYTVDFKEVDRAITQSREEGFVEIVTKKWTSKILGATIVGPRAGEMLAEISLSIYFGIPLRKLASIIHPYPTYSLAIRRAADLWLKQTILPKLLGK